jgi:predicted dehydrogenase
MTAERLRVAVVGASRAHSKDGRDRWAIRAHLPALLAMPDDFEVVAVCTTRMESALDTAEHFGVPGAFDNVDTMLESGGIDAVCVSVAPAHHFEVSMKALESGVHVYCEQPGSVGSEPARQMAELAEKKGLKTVVGFRERHLPVVLYMHDLIEEGFIGTPLLFQHSSLVAAYIQPRPRHRAWLFNLNAGGRPSYRSAGSIDRVIDVVGSEVSEIVGEISLKVESRPDMDGGPPITGNQPDNINYLAKLENGASGVIQMSKTAWFGEKERLEVYGTKGMLKLGPDPEYTARGGTHDYDRPPLRLTGKQADTDAILTGAIRPEAMGSPQPLDPPDHYTLTKNLDPQQEPFIVAQTWQLLRKAIHQNTPIHPNFTDSHHLHTILDTAETSAQEKRWQHVEKPKPEKVKSH